MKRIFVSVICCGDLGSFLQSRKRLAFMVDFKLSNVLLKIDDHLRDFPELIFRLNGSAHYSETANSLDFSGIVDFLTYFNAVSCSKWRKYADIDGVHLRLKLSGDACTVSLVTVPDQPIPGNKNTLSVSKKVIEKIYFSGSGGYELIDVRVPTEGVLLAGFILESEGSTSLCDASWYTIVSEDRIRPIKIALATTTFKKEEYILPNIRSIKREILESSDRIAQNFHMFVVDNGRTLDVAELSGRGVTVIQNANVGGSGGFARGMIEALESDFGFSHVLLMDDDVRVSPESFKRTFNLLSLATEEYKDAFINGAMLQLEHPNMQFEDVSYVKHSGAYERCKGDLCVDKLFDIVANEVMNVEVPQAYGAWWYDCIPLDAVRSHGLPLPLFVRCDDVEFGLRCEPTYMTMNGICVWHEGFGARFRAAVDCYQYVRNFLIMISCDGRINDKLFMARAERSLRIFLRTMAYDAAELIVAGLEDYLKGPEFLMNSDGEEILRRNSKKNEKLVPLEQAISEASESLADLACSLNSFRLDKEVLKEDVKVNGFLKIWRTLPYDRHLLPDVLLRNKPGTIFYGGSTSLSWSQVATRVLIACDNQGKNAHVRIIDRSRYRQIKRRWKTAKLEYRAQRTGLAQAYKDAMPYMTSPAFWKRYLRLTEG